MSALTYIRIRGLEEAGDVFQGIGGDVSVSGGTGGTVEVWSDPVAPAFEIHIGLWNAQNAGINYQSEELTALKGRLGTEVSPTMGAIRTALDFAIELAIKPIISEIVENSTPLAFLGEIGDDAAEWVVDLVTEILLWLLGSLDDLFVGYVRGSGRCDAMIAENTALLLLPMSYENYLLRKEMLDQHETIMQELEGKLTEGNNWLEKFLNFALTVLGLFNQGAATENYDDWDSVIDAIEDVIPTLDDWIQEVYEADESNNIYNPANLDVDGNLINPKPVPVPPVLMPTLPGDSKKNRKLALTYYVIKTLVTLGTEIFRRQKEHDTDAAEGLQALKQAVETGLENLKYNDEVMELAATPNPIRIHLRNAIIEQP